MTIKLIDIECVISGGAVPPVTSEHILTDLDDVFETIKAAMLSWRSYSEYKMKYSSITSSDLDVTEAAQRHSYLFL